ncbi:uncharacterized protein [Palaemon carinicauda]|uniref:uncharacterized protein n=1 Tax=Palaemon carinicauda TaxID=392227 RepID=UPI0035B6656B
MRAAFLVLKELHQVLAEHSDVLMSDNTTVVAYLSKQGGTFSQQLCHMAVEILRWAEDNSVTLSARFIPGKQNVLSDKLSRATQIVGTEWSLNPLIANKVLTLWGSPTVDLFATALNFRLALYCSPVPDPPKFFGKMLSNNGE